MIVNLGTNTSNILIARKSKPETLLWPWPACVTKNVFPVNVTVAIIRVTSQRKTTLSYD